MDSGLTTLLAAAIGAAAGIGGSLGTTYLARKADDSRAAKDLFVAIHTDFEAALAGCVQETTRAIEASIDGALSSHWQTLEPQISSAWQAALYPSYKLRLFGHPAVQADAARLREFVARRVTTLVEHRAYEPWTREVAVTNVALWRSLRLNYEEAVMSCSNTIHERAASRTPERSEEDAVGAWPSQDQAGREP